MTGEISNELTRLEIKGILANTKHLYDICTTSAQNFRRWSNIVQMLYKYFLFAGMVL